MAAPIPKSQGTTPSERYLAKLAENTFLNLWSYPNPFRDQRTSPKSAGKELCDLLVVCDCYVIIFSVKSIDWPVADPAIAWGRWAKRAIRNSAKQTRGAARWIANHTERVFVDKECTVPFPIPFPDPGVREVFQVVVAIGAAEASEHSIPHSSGSLQINPRIQGNTHWDADPDHARPFAIGDVDPESDFVHVFNEFALDVVMGELDTIRDFVDYLQKRQDFIRSGLLSFAHGEEHLLAHYLVRMNDQGEHDFVDSCERQVAPVSIGSGRYEHLLSNPQYIVKKQADAISYVWDDCITLFTTHMLQGTSIARSGYSVDFQRSEEGVRYMALERRFVRRNLGLAIATAIEAASDEICFRRAMIRSPLDENSETAYFIQAWEYPSYFDRRGGYETYRTQRANLAQVVAYGLLERTPHVKQIVGISCEPPSNDRATSEELIFVRQQNWTEDERRDIKRDCKRFNVLTEGTIVRHFQQREYPNTH